MAFIKISDILVFLLGGAILGLWLYLYFKYQNKYPGLFDSLDEEHYPMKDLYFVGYGLQEMLNLQYKTKHDRILHHDLVILYGEKYSGYYLRMVYAKQFTLGLVLAATAAPMYFLSGGSWTMFFLFLGMAVFVGVYYGMSVKDDIKKRNETIMLEFPDVVSKLALLINAGMILREAWEQVAFSREGELYSEMKISVEEIRNGKNEQDALIDFGQRCNIQEIKKFTSTLVQGITKGNRSLAPMMVQQSGEAWTNKKHAIKRLGEAANSKLLIPIGLTFIGILIMVIVPIFSNLGA